MSYNRNLFPRSLGTEFSFDDLRSAFNVGNNQPLSFADLYRGGIYVPEQDNFFSAWLNVPEDPNGRIGTSTSNSRRTIGAKNRGTEISIRDFQTRTTGFTVSHVAEPPNTGFFNDVTLQFDATYRVENGTTNDVRRSLGTVVKTVSTDTGGNWPAGYDPWRGIYYVIEPAYGPDPNFDSSDFLNLDGVQIGGAGSAFTQGSRPGWELNSTEFNVLNYLTPVLNLRCSFAADNKAEGNIDLRIRFPGLDSDGGDLVTTPFTLLDTSIGFINPNFQNTTLYSSTYNSQPISQLLGWDVHRSNKNLGKSTSPSHTGSTIYWRRSGFTDKGINMPIDPTPTPSGSSGTSQGDLGDFASGAVYNFEFKSPTDTVQGGSTQLGYYCMRLYNSGTTQNGYDVVHGPLLTSLSWIPLTTSNSVRFKWRAVGGGDAYDVFAWLQSWDTSPGNHYQQTLLNETQNSVGGDSGWQTVTVQVQNDATYSFAFLCGTFDYSGGKAAGANLYITDIEIL